MGRDYLQEKKTSIADKKLQTGNLHTNEEK